MQKIAICDDEITIGAEIERALVETLTKQDIQHEIDIFCTGADLYEKIKQGVYYDLIFLDIEFAKNQINGVDVGRLIRNEHQNRLASIVYISWEAKYAMELFDLQPLNFLVKPVPDRKIEAVVKTHLKIAGLMTGTFTYKVGHDSFKLQIKDIMYLESRDRKLILHLADGRKEEFYGSIKTAYDEQLSKFDFMYIHNSYVVNFDYISILRFSEVFLMDIVTPLPISKHRRVDVRDRYKEILQKRLG